MPIGHNVSYWPNRVNHYEKILLGKDAGELTSQVPNDTICPIDDPKAMPPAGSMPNPRETMATRPDNTHAFWRLKNLRGLKGVTLEDLAQRTGLTKSFLSKVERGKSMPSIATALKIADAFEVGVGDLFGASETAKDFAVVRKTERKPFSGRRFKAGHRYEAIAPGHFHGLYEAFVDHPPFDEPPHHQRAQHRGHEMLFVIKGKIDVAFPHQSVKLEEGDSIVFSGQIPHRVLSLRPKRAEILVIVTNDRKEPGSG
jgi:transcriptional regulator with XRE-family HTH domain